MARCIGRPTKWTQNNTQSKSSRYADLNKTKNSNNVLSTKLISSPTSKNINTSSSTSTCSKPPIISTLSTNTATAALLKEYSKNNVSYLKKKHSLSTNSSSKPSKYSTSTTLCIEISSPTTFSLATELSNWETLDSAKV